MHTLEFFFDCSSPWTYLAFEQVQRSMAPRPVAIEWRPFLVGGVFNTVNPSVYEGRARPVPLKANYYGKDLADWARYVGIEIGRPPVFPVNSVKAMRGAFVAIEEDCLVPYARRLRLAHDVPRRRRHVLRQRPHSAGGREGGRGLRRRRSPSRCSSKPSTSLRIAMPSGRLARAARTPAPGDCRRTDLRVAGTSRWLRLRPDPRAPQTTAPC